MKKVLVSSMMVLFFAAGVSAQDSQKPITAGKTGLSFFMADKIFDFLISEGVGGSSLIHYQGVSLIWHAAESFAVEPAVFFNFRDNTYKGSSSVPDNDTYLIGGASLGLFYYSQLKGNAYMYLGPRFDYFYSQSMDNGTASSYTEYVTRGIGAGLVFGLKYMFNENIAIFGDISGGYTRTDSEKWDFSGSSGVKNMTSSENNNIFSLSKGILGVTIYFN